jgi:hypothetical protein
VWDLSPIAQITNHSYVDDQKEQATPCNLKGVGVLCRAQADSRLPMIPRLSSHTGNIGNYPINSLKAYHGVVREPKFMRYGAVRNRSAPEGKSCICDCASCLPEHVKWSTWTRVIAFAAAELSSPTLRVKFQASGAVIVVIRQLFRPSTCYSRTFPASAISPVENPVLFLRS